MVTKIEEVGGSFRYDSVTRYRNGAETHTRYDAMYDGKPVIVKSSRGLLLPVSLSRIDARTALMTKNETEKSICLSGTFFETFSSCLRATAMGIASAWGRVGAVSMLLVFGHFFAILHRSILFYTIDPVLIVAAIVVLCFGPSTRGRPLQEAVVSDRSIAKLIMMAK